MPFIVQLCGCRPAGIKGESLWSTAQGPIDSPERGGDKEAFLRGLVRPHGLAIHDGYLYIGEPSRIVRVPYEPGDLKTGGNTETVGGNRSLGSGGGHWTRNIAFAPDHKTFYVAVGSAGNTNPEDPPRVTVQRFDADGAGQSTFATGLRNPVGIAFHPDTDELYVVVNERDGLGDDLVPDYLTRVRERDFFGWPYAYRRNWTRAAARGSWWSRGESNP